MIKQNLTLSTNTNGKKKKNSGTSGLYGDFIGGTGNIGNISAPTVNPSGAKYSDLIDIAAPAGSSGGAYTGDSKINPNGSFGYSDVLPELSTTPTNKNGQVVSPTWGTGNNSKLPPSAPSGVKNNISVAPIDKSQYFDSSVVGTVGGGFSGGKKGGVTNEGEIIGTRYCDDIVFLDSNKRKLHKAKTAFDASLKKENLRLKPDWQVWKYSTRPIDFVGYRFYGKFTLLRKKLFYSLTRAVRMIKRFGIRVRQVMRFLSEMGWAKRINFKRYYIEQIKPVISKGRACRFMSYNSAVLSAA